MENDRLREGIARRDLLRLAASGAIAPSLVAHSDRSEETRDSQKNSYDYGMEYDAPAFRYTCDQLHDPKAIAAADPIFCGATDQWHQLGNDRLVAKASNFGYIQVRQDEGAPKFLNDYIPREGEFGGGIGYLSDGEQIVATYYTGTADRIERTFGLGYYRKLVTAHGYTIDQTTFAPFGDDPVLLTHVTIHRHTAVRNSDASAKLLRWTEYWGCRTYEFFGADKDVCTETETLFLRRIFAKRFRHTFQRLHGGLLETKTYMHDPAEYPNRDPWHRRSRRTAEMEIGLLNPSKRNCEGLL